ncbi:MAG TPA: imidazole glycerol phosphate synthase subunit HisH [Spirochaetales bacterium]|nr:imidazole glycerol phosphate synthase subunit HisH [Spirochaetales bacterium]
MSVKTAEKRVGKGAGEDTVLVIASTGAANLASVRTMCRRLGIKSLVTSEPSVIEEADYALLPGVGAFGAAMSRLEETGLDEAFKGRVAQKKPTMGICLGMQLFCESSEEGPGIKGLGIVPAHVASLDLAMPLPQLGWNYVSPYVSERQGEYENSMQSAVQSVEPKGECSFVRPGWAYFANSYAIESIPEGFIGTVCIYGKPFVASLELWDSRNAMAPYLLLCQFHPELSGAWGLDLVARWIGSGEKVLDAKDNSKGANLGKA